MNEHLMRALLFAALFFETSSDGDCDPDLAGDRCRDPGAGRRPLLESDE